MLLSSKSSKQLKMECKHTINKEGGERAGEAEELAVWDAGDAWEEDEEVDLEGGVFTAVFI